MIICGNFLRQKSYQNKHQNTPFYNFLPRDHAPEPS